MKITLLGWTFRVREVPLQYIYIDRRPVTAIRKARIALDKLIAQSQTWLKLPPPRVY